MQKQLQKLSTRYFLPLMWGLPTGLKADEMYNFMENKQLLSVEHIIDCVM